MAALACGPASAVDFPKHDITFVVPYSPGGGSDLQARRLEPGPHKALGVNIHIVYKTGGGGAVGFLALRSAKPDGYTIPNVVAPNIIVTSRGKDVGYKPSDFSHIAMTETAPDTLVVPKDSKFKTLKDLVAYAKAHPGKLAIAGTGSTGKSHVAEIVQHSGSRLPTYPSREASEKSFRTSKAGTWTRPSSARRTFSSIPTYFTLDTDPRR